MTDHFLFENLTWPEVAELNRETSLVLPLGDGYDKLEIDADSWFSIQYRLAACSALWLAGERVGGTGRDPLSLH